ncbi:ABC transporter substrate-binding protein [Vacuolonema iberomarrocanum]|uniref:ABC transporter substrate-binding protein n=1 Tax=Vacuolonema iberomarrocanum TaxID=3454632 RepID=UPI003F6DCD59
MHVRVGIKTMALFLATLVAVVTFSACAANQPSDESISPSAGRTIQHGMGETIVPQTPERVVVLWSAVDTLALGVKPVGAVLSEPPQIGGDELTPMFSDRTEGIVAVGSYAQPNLERIVELQPDLILGITGVESFYPHLSQIAPTVIVDISGGVAAWKEYVLSWATALGKPNEAQALIQQYEQRIAQFHQAMGDRLNTTVVSVARFGTDQVRIYQKDSFPGAVLAEAGLLRPESQQRNNHDETISLESLSSIDGDVLFFVQDDPDESALAKAQESQLWSQLDVVQRDQIHEVSVETWFLNLGIVSAHMMLNDLFRTLVPDGEQYVIHQVGELPLP